MTPERWQRIKDLLYQAQQLKAEERPAFLHRSCSMDDSLRAEVETLLVSSDEARSSFLESSPTQVTLMPGTRLGDYEVHNLLGLGGMGEVYRARDLHLRRDVAIKVLPSLMSSDKERLRRFEQEAQAAAALNHPNILAVFQLGTFQGAPYLVSELLEGQTLREHVKRGPLQTRKTIDYAVQIAHGLAAAHEKGIVHRDLKPENLFVTRDGRLKILDFGLAKLKQPEPNWQIGALTAPASATEPGTVMGTVGYMSPEQIWGQNVDHRSDIFSFGTILYEMLAGRRAFQEPTAAETMSAVLNEEPPSISEITPNIPPALQRVAHRCLEKDPAARFQSALDLAFALQALSDTAGSPKPTLIASSSRKRWFVVTCAVGAAFLGIISAIWFEPANAVPVVQSVVQLTKDGQEKTGNVETDGTRIYFNEGPIGSLRIAQVSVNGGQTGDVPTALVNPQVSGLTADGSNLLLLVGAPLPTRQLIWSLPLPAGEARKLADAEVTDATFFPDGRLLYAENTALFVSDKDGTNAHKLGFEISTVDSVPSVSPDGRQLIFSYTDRAAHSWVINEAASDGTRVHSVLKSGQDLPQDVCCPRWMQDGKHVIFAGRSEGRWDLWTFADPTMFMRKASQVTRLTAGPISYLTFTVGRGGDKVLAAGVLRRGELARFDPKIRKFLPYLGGISAHYVSFSRDGKWMAYLSYPDYTIWRSRADGSERQQLTYLPMLAGFPQISPDGSKVSFSSSDGKAYIVSMSGGTPQKLSDVFAAGADWSPDGRYVAITSNVESAGHYVLRPEIIDTRTGAVSLIPESLGAFGPWFVTQDQLITASEDQSKFLLFDLKTKKRSDLVAVPGGLVSWQTSPDRRYLVYSTGGKDPAIFRLNLSNRSVEEVASLKDVANVDDPYMGIQVGVAPDNSVLITRDLGTQEIYALSVKWP